MSEEGNKAAFPLLCVFASLRLCVGSSHFARYPRLISFIIVVLTLLTPLNAQEVRPAEVLLEAAQYARAHGALDELASPKLKAWQSQALLYDQGTIYLQQGDWEQAMAAFTAISLDGDPSPLLLSSLKINLGIALLERARHLRELTPAPYAVIMALESEAVDSFRQAGGSEMSSGDSPLLQRLGSIELAAAVQENNEATLETSTLQEGLPLLLLSLSNTLTDISFMESEGVDHKSIEQYLRIFMKQQEPWGILWETQRNNWIAFSPDDSQGKAGLRLYTQAEKHKDRGLSMMQRSLWAESRRELAAATASLIACMRVLFGENPQQDILQHLLNSYKRLLRREIITAEALNSLEKEQEQLMEVAKTDSMLKSLESLKTSQTSLKQGERLSARLFLEIAQEHIRHSLAAFQAQTPQSILEEAIAQETFAATILYVRLQINKKVAFPDEPWRSAQASVLEAASHFLPVVLELQTQNYRGHGQHRCQARPWSEVLPLFEQGREEAEKANELLAKAGFRAALQHEGRALIIWQQALAALKKPLTDTSSACQSQGGASKPQENSPPENTSQEKAQNTAPQSGVNDILRILQELNEDDRLPKTDRGIKKQGLRPW